jgi:hypothetical protein
MIIIRIRFPVWSVAMNTLKQEVRIYSIQNRGNMTDQHFQYKLYTIDEHSQLKILKYTLCLIENLNYKQ